MLSRSLSGASWIVVLAAALVWPARGRAESIVLLSARGDEGLEHEREQAQRFLSEALAAAGARVLARADAIGGLPSGRAKECDAVECAPALVAASGADLAVAVGLWAAADVAAAGSVLVTLVDREGKRYPGKARVEDADLRRAVEDALLDARALQLLGPGPWLRIRGEPAGAEVLLNGKLIGTVPYRAPIDSGRYTLEVRSGGHRPHVQTVDVPPSAARQVELDIELTPRDEVIARLALPGTPAERHALGEDGPKRSGPVVGPLILGGAGLAVLAADVVMVLSTGCDRRNTLGHCEDGGEINEAWAVTWAGVGASAIVGAVLWHVLGAGHEPREVAVQASPHGAALVLSGDL